MESLLYSTEPRLEHTRAFLRESPPREIALSLLRARRFPRNLGFTYQLDTVHVLQRRLRYMTRPTLSMCYVMYLSLLSLAIASPELREFSHTLAKSAT